MVDSCTAAHGECLFHDSNFTVIVPVKSFRRLSVAGRTYILSKFPDINNRIYQNFLLMHSIGVNVSGQIASVIADGLILALVKARIGG